jgi:hypothetical protein
VFATETNSKSGVTRPGYAVFTTYQQAVCLPRCQAGRRSRSGSHPNAGCHRRPGTSSRVEDCAQLYQALPSRACPGDP